MHKNVAEGILKELEAKDEELATLRTERDVALKELAAVNELNAVVGNEAAELWMHTDDLDDELVEVRQVLDEIKKRVKVMRVSESKSWEMMDGTIHSAGEHSLRVYDDILAILDECHEGNK